MAVPLKVSRATGVLVPSLPGSTSFARFFGETSFLGKDEVTERILSVVKDFGKVEEGKLSPTAHFNKDLGLDSLDAVEVVMALEEEFAIEIPDAEADRILSVGDAVTYITAHPHAV
ncbi:acyl carrier protein [Pseudoscourfieldia marina]